MTTNYEIARCDETSPYHSGKGRSYIVTYRGRLIGHLDIHASGHRDWQFNAEAGPTPSVTTQRRLVKSVRNER
jgi:hypothetical protein